MHEEGVEITAQWETWDRQHHETAAKALAGMSFFQRNDGVMPLLALRAALLLREKGFDSPSPKPPPPGKIAAIFDDLASQPDKIFARCPY